MKAKTRFFTHFSFLSALFVMGGAVISLPHKNADRYTFLGFLLSLALALLFCLIFSFAARFTDRRDSPLCKILLPFVFCGLAVLSLYSAADTFIQFIRFAHSVILPDSTKAVPAILLGFTVFFFFLKRQEDILKFFLPISVFCLASVIFFFFATLENYNIKNIFIYELPSARGLVQQTLPYLKVAALPVIILPFYQQFVQKKQSASVTLGVVFGFAMLGTALLGSVLLFGNTLAGRLDYPYSAAVSTVTIGRLFARMDLLSYFLYFFSAIARIGVSFYTAYASLKHLKALIFEK